MFVEFAFERNVELTVKNNILLSRFLFSKFSLCSVHFTDINVVRCMIAYSTEICRLRFKMKVFTVTVHTEF